MGLVENLKDIADLIKKAGDIDLYRKITALESEVIDLTRANRHLEIENDDLKTRLSTKAQMLFKPPFWYREGDAVPHCPRCWESDQKAVHLHGPIGVHAGTRFDCPQCKQMFIAERTGLSNADARRGPW